MELEKLALYRDDRAGHGRGRPGARRRRRPGLDLGVPRRGRQAARPGRRWRSSTACCDDAGAGARRRSSIAGSASCSSSPTGWPAARPATAAAGDGHRQRVPRRAARGAGPRWTTAELEDALDGLLELDAMVKGAPGTRPDDGTAPAGVHAVGGGPRRRAASGARPRPERSGRDQSAEDQACSWSTRSLSIANTQRPSPRSSSSIRSGSM